jgi:hypothetical protein
LGIPATVGLSSRVDKSTDVRAEGRGRLDADSVGNVLPAGWQLDYDSGRIPGGGRSWRSGMASDLAELRVVPRPVDPFDLSWKNEEYDFRISSLQGEEMGVITVMGKTSDAHLTLRPDTYLVEYERRRGKNPDNFKMRCGKFPVDLSRPGMYGLKFSPKLGSAEITGGLDDCYALNFEKVGAGPRIDGLVYQHPPKQYLLDGLPPGKYRLSGVRQRQGDNVFVSHAEVTVKDGDRAIADIDAAALGTCSLHGKILGKLSKPRADLGGEFQWFVLIRKPNSPPVTTADAYEALTMDTIYVVRGRNVVTETEEQARYHLEEMAPGKYTATVIEHDLWGGAFITRQQSKPLTIKANEEAVLDFDLEGTENQSGPLSIRAASATESQFVATLSNGVTVELLGVVRVTDEGMLWQRADGTPMQPIQGVVEADLDFGASVLLFRTEPASVGIEPPYYLVRNEKKFLDHDSFWYMPNANVWFVPMEKGRRFVHFGMNVNNLETVHTIRLTAGDIGKEIEVNQYGLHKILKLSPRGSESFEAIIDQSVDWDMYRLAAVDKKGVVHKRSSTYADKLKFNFPIEELAGLVIQRKYPAQVEFKSVSLRPTFKTDVEVGVPPAPVDKRTRKQEIADRLAAFEEHRHRVQGDLDTAEQALQEVRKRWGIVDLEVPSGRAFQHRITLRLSNLELQRDELILQMKELQAAIGELERVAKGLVTAQVSEEMDRDPVIISLTQQLALLQSKLATRIAELGKDHEQVQQTEQLIGEVKEQMEVRRIEVAKQVGQVRLRQAQGQLVVLSQKREELENMRAEAEAQQRELDSARIQYQKRLAIKDERQERLDAIKEQIEKLKIMHDDPEVDEVSRGFYERLTAARAEGLDRRLSRQEIAAKLASLEDRRRRIEVELSVAEEAMQEVRTRYGFTDLEDRSYPHPVTQRLIRLERQRDECTLEIAQLQAQIGNLEDQADTPQGKANLKKAQEELVILSERLEALQEMSEQAEAKKRDLDVARVQHKQRAAIRDERKRMLESIKADIERWKILHDDPQTLETPPAPEAR